MAKSINLEKLNARFEKAQPEEILRWAIETFSPKIAVTSSFQTESVALLDMVSKINPAIQILFLETGWHFPGTLAFKSEIVKRLGLTNVTDLKADPKKREAFNAKTGGKPYEADPDRCCQINKVEPLEEALKGLDAWVSGIRRSQSETRKDIKIIEAYQGLFKINPLANATSGDIWWYLKEHNLPKHPLFDKGYLSIGCWPCTRPVQPGDDERSGRWAGKEKTECGIHTSMKPKLKKPEAPEENQEGSNI
ncbi:MAG: phosphoadenylyl-sulfate reductase [Candidatus Omnitrophica bacterium]|nr:phosphoadenylyl-sulfate reductase [Candidatus Omnitrophota bacterium]